MNFAKNFIRGNRNFTLLRLLIVSSRHGSVSIGRVVTVRSKRETHGIRRIAPIGPKRKDVVGNNRLAERKRINNIG